jgi:hypothetical protein
MAARLGVVPPEVWPTKSFETSVNIQQSTERNKSEKLLLQLDITFCVLSFAVPF